ncbi:hypothetical protein [Goodfellowiella coeruleoviolacea]|uniref:Uncharacterized protein n=1 Tax=Goodfellowiella coeruleoviolacea TaxID=334858 RepID=A0AAE3KG56_9PSEU|nr:hypothetical protein [Goodfellowiella coeruleoviolacea]MCP2167031.1 hypothetical protein [Goodfellowiella coeruleoviolacea]
MELVGDVAAAVELARSLRAADTGGWRASGVRQVLDQLGAGARAHPVGEFERRFVHAGEEFVGITVPVATAEPTHAAQAACFRQVAEALTEEFGAAPILGSYGGVSPFYGGQLSPWGSHFLRWRGRPNSLELRAGAAGPELLLHPTEPVEDWFWRQGQGVEFELAGFFAFAQRDRANEGLGLPGGWRAGDWDTFHRALRGFLAALPTETAALGVALSPGIYLSGANGAVMVDLEVGDDLEIIAYALDKPATVDFAGLGWPPPSAGGDRPTPASLPVVGRTGGIAPGEVDAAGLASLLVDTARAIGVAAPDQLCLRDWSQRAGDYRVNFYGLTLSER